MKLRASRKLFATLACLGPAVGFAQAPSSADVNAANNPLTPKVTINLHDYWAPKLYDSDDYTNQFLLRGLIPHRLGGAPQLLRFTMPALVTVPDGTGGTTTGTGDLNLLDLFPFKAGSVEFGIGPQLTIPTASRPQTGTRLWQAGLGAVAIAPQSWGLLGGLLTWQHSFAGPSDRPTQNNLTFQPFFIYNLPEGFYLRSTGTWTFDLERHTYFIPVGAGVGKVWVLGGGTTVNVFAEPQWTVSHDGPGQPKFQVFAGVNLQFPVGKK